MEIWDYTISMAIWDYTRAFKSFFSHRCSSGKNSKKSEIRKRKDVCQMSLWIILLQNLGKFWINWLIFESEIRKMMIFLPFKKMIWGYESSTGTEIWNFPGLPPESIILIHNLEYFTPLERQTCISTWYGRILQGPVICHCSHVQLVKKHTGVSRSQV